MKFFVRIDFGDKSLMSQIFFFKSPANRSNIKKHFFCVVYIIILIGSEEGTVAHWCIT